MPVSLRHSAARDPGDAHKGLFYGSLGSVLQAAAVSILQFPNPLPAQAMGALDAPLALAGTSQNRRRRLWPSEGAQPLGAARDGLVTLSGSCGLLSARRQASEESLLAMAARSEWFGATASKDSSLELAPPVLPGRHCRSE